MTTLSTRPMRLLLVEFNELYDRHLCRHSQFGINVVHLISLFAVWYAVYGLLYTMLSLTGLAVAEWLIAVPALIYVAAVTPNVPIRVLGATGLFLGLIVASAVFVRAPWWVYLIMIPVFYEIQSLSHKVWTVAADMTEFNKKYAKGKVLFVVLLIYEVPIVLNYLLFAGSPRPLVAVAAHEEQEPAVLTPKGD
jgi:hypothetical protein